MKTTSATFLIAALLGCGNQAQGPRIPQQDDQVEVSQRGEGEAQGEEPSLQESIHSNLSQILNIRAGAAQRLNLLVPQLVLPNFYATTDDLPERFAFLRAVPKRRDRIFVSTDQDIHSQLLKIAPTIAVGNIKLTEAQQERVERARQLLYDRGKPSKLLLAYRKYRQEYDDLGSQIEKESSEARREQLSARRQELSARWSARPDTEKIEEALEILDRYDNTEIVRGIKAWKKSLNEAPTNSYGIDWSALGRRGGWRSVSFPIQSSLIEVKTGAGGKKTTNLRVRPGEATFSMRLQLLSVVQADLDALLQLKPNLWKSEKYIVSDGDDAKDSANELVPRVITTVLVAKEIELQISNDTAWNRIANLLKDDEVASVGGFQLPTDQFYVIPNQIVINRPSLIGVLIKTVPKTPDPDPKLVFDQ